MAPATCLVLISINLVVIFMSRVERYSGKYTKNLLFLIPAIAFFELLASNLKLGTIVNINGSVIHYNIVRMSPITAIMLLSLVYAVYRLSLGLESISTYLFCIFPILLSLVIIWSYFNLSEPLFYGLIRTPVALASAFSIMISSISILFLSKRSLPKDS